MTARDVTKYESCREIADRIGVKIEARWELIALTAKDGACLGGLSTVDELYAFLCGYEYYASAKSLFDLAEHASS